MTASATRPIPLPPQTTETTRRQRECDENPLCLNGQWSFMPSGSMDYRLILGNPMTHQGGLGFKFLFYNRENRFAGPLRGEHAFAIGPELHAFGGEGQEGGALGITLRYLKTPDLREFSGMLRWGIDLSLRGGFGAMNSIQNGFHYEGDFGFFSCDLTLMASLSILTFSIGLGLRSEFWPDLIPSETEIRESSQPRIFPTFTLGLGVF